MDQATISALIGAGGSLASGLGQGLFGAAQAREQARREAEMTKGKQLADIYQAEGQQKSNALANLIEAYRSAML